jgi:tetratricopeptide (TPR) repeat protein
MKNSPSAGTISFSTSVSALFSMIIFLMTACQPIQKAQIAEKTETIRTYPFSEPDPVPILTRSSLWGRGALLYPYFFFDRFSQTAENKQWKVITMDNPYIQVSILPEVGGKIWGATEHSTGKEFIYKNHVLKFREIALRGPWTSGGIEFNFGIVGHTPSASTPVDYLIKENPDGSVSCVVGNLDLASRTRWSVTVSLPKDKAYFETKAFWYNPSPYHQSYYAWMNAAVKAADDLQFVFPGVHHIGHNYRDPLKPWPIDEKGRDLSWYKNNNFGSSKSYFTVGEYENFFGGYWHDSRFGFGHWALYDDVPGHKIWIWGLSRQGMIWEDLLTDSDGQYCEPQAGRYFNQSDHGLFIPYAADSWREIWFPYKDIGPLVKASPAGILNVEVEEDTVRIGLFPLQKMDEDLVILQDGKEIYRETLVLEPAQVYKKNVLCATNGKRRIDVRVGATLNYTNDAEANDLKRPIRFHPYDEDTIQGLYLSARRQEQERNYYTALEKYLACLEREPLHVRALCRVAEIYCRRGQYETALFYAHRALLNDMYDPEANYVYGIISRRMGSMRDAKETLGWAARSLQYRSGAYNQMAEIFFLENAYDLALEYAQRALDFNTYNINARLLTATVFRKNNQSLQARQALEKILEIDPLNHLCRFELYLLTPKDNTWEAFRSKIRNELPDETFMELACYYVHLGMEEEAIKLLESVSGYPTACYWLAYLTRKNDKSKTRTYLDKAQNLSPLLVFPFREESIPVFQWASSVNPSDWRAKYYLALIYWSKGRVQEARDKFDKCGQPDYAPFYLARGHFYKNVDLALTLADFEKAVQIDDKSWKVWHTLVSFYNQQKFTEVALVSARKASLLFPENVSLQVELVKALMADGQYKEAAAILENMVALPHEGARAIHEIFILCHVHLGLEAIQKREYSQAIKFLEKARTYPENLGTGRPYDPDQRMQDYFIAYCYEKMNEKDKAEEIRKSIYDYTIKVWDTRHPNHYFGALVFRQLGERRKARELMRKGKIPEEFRRKINKIGVRL